MSDAQPTEVEAKLLAPDETTLDSLAGCRSLGDYRLGPPEREVLDTLYLDTPAGDVRRQRIAVRVRRTPRKIELTVKLPGKVSGDVHARPETTVDLSAPPDFPFRPPQGPVRELLVARGLDRPLSPFLRMKVDRRTVTVCAPGSSRPFAELALDAVHFELPRAADVRPRRVLYEVEVELVEHADEGELDCFVEELRRTFPLEPSLLSKLERGIAWLEAEGVERRTR